MAAAEIFIEAKSDDSYVAAFEFDGNTYVMEMAVASNAGTLTNLVMLQDITGITDVDTTGAANTILIA